MIGIYVDESTYGTLSVTASAAVYTAALDEGFYEIFADDADIYVKVIRDGEAEAAFSVGYPIWAGNSVIRKVPASGKIGCICKSGQPSITVEYIGVAGAGLRA